MLPQKAVMMPPAEYLVQMRIVFHSLYGWVGMMTPSSKRPTDLPGAEGLAGKLSTLVLMPLHLAPGSHWAPAAQQ